METGLDGNDEGHGTDIGKGNRKGIETEIGMEMGRELR